MMEVQNMSEYPKFVKDKLLSVIDSMADHINDFVRNPERDFIRCRMLDFKTMIKFILSAGSNTLASELLNFFSFENTPSVSAFVQQREKLLPKAFQYLFHEFNRVMDVTPTLFHDYRILAVDGSDLTIPFNPVETENIRDDEHCNFLHLHTLYDVCSKVYVDAVITSGTKYCERDIAADMVQRLSEKYPVILLADRGYETYNIFAHVEERLFDYVIRIKDFNSNGILSGIDFPDTEEFDITRKIVLTRHSTGPALINRKVYKFKAKGKRFDFLPDLDSPDYELEIRFVRLKIDNDKYIVLATSLESNSFSVELLKELYHLRWGIETSYRETKWVLGMASCHSKKADSIKQEIFAHLTMYNFSMYITMRIKPEKKKRKRKYPMQINYTQAIKICLQFFRSCSKLQTFDVEATILKYTLPVRNSRTVPRKAVSPCVESFNYRLS